MNKLIDLSLEVKNAFDVALAHYSSTDTSILPTVNWLTVKDYKVNQEVVIPAEYDRMFLIVVHRGPETAKAEQAFAKACGAANFTFAFGSASANNGTAASVASAKPKTVAKKKSTTKKKATSKSIMSEILANVDRTNASGEKLGKGSEEEQAANMVEYELAEQRLKFIENIFIAQVKKEIAGDSSTIAREFITFYANSSPERKICLCGIMRKLKEILIFEKLQGSATAVELLEMIEADENGEVSEE